uniref:Uncharacterized protein n=1 Tax=Anguilla anguilla TaxID=7936 RepID=A0A0E9PEM8_ANGAN
MEILVLVETTGL